MDFYEKYLSIKWTSLCSGYIKVVVIAQLELYVKFWYLLFHEFVNMFLNYIYTYAFLSVLLLTII